MNFERYRETIKRIQKLADNFSSMTRSDLSELNKLNGECLSFNEEMVKSLTALVDEIEDGLTLLLDRLGQIKKDLVKISGPEGTLGELLQMEAVYLRAAALRENIREMLKTPGEVPAPLEDTGASPASGDLKNLIGLARKEAAAAVEKAPAPKIATPAKVQKKEDPVVRPENKKPVEAVQPAPKASPSKKDQKPAPPRQGGPAAPITLAKEIGEAEKKLMAEITKNIEAIKSKKK